MSKINYVVVLILLLSLALVAAGCGNNQTEPEPAPPPAASSEESSTAESSVDESGDNSTAGDVEEAAADASLNDASDATQTPAEQVDGEGDDLLQNDQAQNEQTQNDQAQPALNGEIVLWHSWAGAEGDALAEILLEFQARYPGVQVETLFIAHDDLLQSYAESVFAEEGPSLLLAPNWWLGEMILLQLLAPFGPELAQTTLEGLFPAALDSMVWDETLYGVPIHVTTPAVYINTTLYQEPMPQTLDAWHALAAQDPQLGIGLYANLYHLAWGFDAYGVDLFDEQGRAVIDEHDGMVDFLQWLRRVNELDGSYVDQDYGMLLDRYYSGEFAFFVDGPWSYDDLSAALDGEIAVAPLPAGPVGAATPWLYADGLFLNPNTDDATRRVAVTFAQHLSSAASGEILANTGNLLPANRTLNLPANHRLGGFHAQAESATAMPTNREMDAVWGYGGDMILRALLSHAQVAGAEDSAETEDTLTEELEALVAETATLINEANGR